LLVGEPQDVTAAQEQFQGAPPEFDIVQAATNLAVVTDALESHRVTDVLLLSPQWLEDGGQELVYQIDEKGVNVLLRVRGVDTMLGLKSLAQVSGLPFIQLRPSALPLSSAHFKRIIDLVLVVGTAPVWLPVLGLIALYQLGVAGKPIFYVQQRVGLGNKTFPMIKFRTMGLEAENSSGAVLSSADDDRVIPACKWVRATRMDELPQLFNVLAGHMSIVGPRPERPELIATFGDGIQGYERRHAVRPGLTGLAQIYGRYNTKPEYKLGYDLHYAANWSALLDAEILLRTVGVVLLRRV
jgi:lipopolysaccharide/colanic/teichoic acid biosynthesis glycosyltransferase